MGALITEVFVPVILLCVGMAFTKVQFFIDADPRVIQPSLFGEDKQTVFINSNLMETSSGYDITPNELLKNMPGYSSKFDFEVITTPSTSLSTAKERSSALSNFDESIFAKKNLKAPYNYLGYYVLESNNYTKQFKVAAMMNVTSQDIVPMSTQFYYEAVLK